MRLQDLPGNSVARGCTEEKLDATIMTIPHGGGCDLECRGDYVLRGAMRAITCATSPRAHKHTLDFHSM